MENIESMNISLSDPFDSKRNFLEKEAAYVRFKRHFGNTVPFFFINGEPYLSLGPHWKVFVFAFIFLVSVGIYVAVLVGAFLSVEWQIVSIAAVFVEAASYLSVSLRNPGMLTQHEVFANSGNEIIKDSSYCGKCRVIRPATACHCSDCDVCIEEYDHHCPWTGKCIGKNNQKLFNFFLGSTLTYFFICIYLGSLAMYTKDHGHI